MGPNSGARYLPWLSSAGLTVTCSTDFAVDRRANLLVVLGGDGTLHRFLPDLIGSELPVLPFPCGSGNDFSRALRITSVQVALELAHAFAHGNARICDVDIGIITDGFGKDTPFGCTGGVGLDAIASQFANRLPRWIRGHGGYLLAATRALVANPALRLRITAKTTEGGDATEDYATDIENNSCLFSFANTPSFGGGLRIAPSAQLDDGQFDCVLVNAMTRPKLVGATISLLKGTHLQLKDVHSIRAKALRIESSPPAAVYADGEYVCKTPVNVRISSRALQVLRAD
ncbi:MAG TPA: diacylglycerol kinase family protein [Terriglobales bacterium]|nr:diacylglycerol kinase family protein [Terriglobales bacterium]